MERTKGPFQRLLFLHSKVCCLTIRTKYKIVSPNIDSSRRLVAHNDYDLPVQVPPVNDLQMADEEVLCEESSSSVKKTSSPV